jgi:hypothetical protein
MIADWRDCKVGTATRVQFVGRPGDRIGMNESANDELQRLIQIVS